VHYATFISKSALHILTVSNLLETLKLLDIYILVYDTAHNPAISLVNQAVNSIYKVKSLYN